MDVSAAATGLTTLDTTLQFGQLDDAAPAVSRGVAHHPPVTLSYREIDAVAKTRDVATLFLSVGDLKAALTQKIGPDQRDPRVLTVYIRTYLPSGNYYGEPVCDATKHLSDLRLDSGIHFFRYDPPLDRTSTIHIECELLTHDIPRLKKTYAISGSEIATFVRADATARLTVAHLRAYLRPILDPASQLPLVGFPAIVIAVRGTRPVSDDVLLDQTTAAFWANAWATPSKSIEVGDLYMGDNQRTWVTAANVHEAMGGVPKPHTSL